MNVRELMRGLEIRASSFVGRVSLGDVTITIRPKITGAPLLSLFRYAYGLRRLDTYDPANFASEDDTFQDLLIRQLVAEVSELLQRGVHREYERARGELTSPRGRIEFSRYFSTARGAETTLPCVYHPRSEDTLLNRVLLAGIDLAARLAIDRELRGHALRIAKMLGETVSTRALNRRVMADGWRAIDRRTIAYGPAFKIIQLLLTGQGLTLDEPSGEIGLSGFLFDMNRFFQALMARFLHEHLDDVDIHDEFRLKGMFGYQSGHNPLKRHNPVLRPDFVLLRDARIVAVLDAKYRDLWELPLPREMLYQLALYALSRTGAHRVAVIIYPTLDNVAREQRIIIQEPLRGAQEGRIALRPVNLLEMDQLLRAGPSAASQRVALAQVLAYSEAVRSDLIV